MNELPPPVADPVAPPKRRAVKVLLILVVGMVLALPLIRSSLVDWNDVPSLAMEPSILRGDRIVVNRAAYDLELPFSSFRLLHRGDPKLGDLVIFLSPVDGRRLLMRVIGMPGDLIELRGGRLHRNGQSATYTQADQETIEQVSSKLRSHMLIANEDLEGRSHLMMVVANASAAQPFGPVSVPAESYFVLGDNRDNSRDSRYLGFVPRKNIVGRAEWVVFSFDRQDGFKPRTNRFFIRLR